MWKIGACAQHRIGMDDSCRNGRYLPSNKFKQKIQPKDELLITGQQVKSMDR